MIPLFSNFYIFSKICFCSCWNFTCFFFYLINCYFSISIIDKILLAVIYIFKYYTNILTYFNLFISFLISINIFYGIFPCNGFFIFMIDTTI